MLVTLSVYHCLNPQYFSGWIACHVSCTRLRPPSFYHKVCAGDEDGDCDDEAFLGEKAVPLQVRMPVATRMQALGYSSDKCTCYSHCSFLACHRRWLKIDPYETVVCWAKERGKCSGAKSGCLMFGYWSRRRHYSAVLIRPGSTPHDSYREHHQGE